MQRYRYAWLLLSLVVCLIASPVAERTETGAVLITLLFTLVMVAMVNAATNSRINLGVALAFSALWLPTGWLSLALGLPLLRVGAGVLLMILIVLSIYGVLRELFHVKESDVDILCAAIAAYLLIGVGWAVSYDLIQYLMPESFDHRSWSDLLYFSLGKLTTAGSGSVAARTALVGIWANVEAVIGQLYLAVLVARLVGLLRR